MAVSFIHSSFKLYVPLNGMQWLAKWLQRERERTWTWPSEIKQWASWIYWIQWDRDEKIKRYAGSRMVHGDDGQRYKQSTLFCPVNLIFPPRLHRSVVIGIEKWPLKQHETHFNCPSDRYFGDCIINTLPARTIGISLSQSPRAQWTILFCEVE